MASVGKNISGGTQYRVVPRDGGKYYAVERRSGGSTLWVPEGSSAPTKEAAEQIVLNLSQGKTANGTMDVSEVPQSDTFKMEAPTGNSTVDTSVEGGVEPEEPKKSPLGGLTTEEWVAKQKAAGLSDDAIMQAYEAEGYSRDGGKFKAALAKYSSEEKTPAEPSTSTPAPAETPVPANTPTESSVYGTKASRVGKYLAQNMIDAYRNGDFGETYPDKDDSELTPEQRHERRMAKLNFGTALLNQISTALANGFAAARGQSPNLVSTWDKMKAENAEVNKSIRAYEAQYNAAKEEVLASLSEAEKSALSPAELDSRVLELLQRKGITAPQTREGLYTTGNTQDIKERETQKDVLSIQSLTQAQKQTATQNLTSLLARRSELQQAINALQSDQGWDAYKQAMEAYVGTARGLESVGLIENANTAINKGSTVGLSGNIGTGGVIGKFVDVGLSGNKSWSSSSSASAGKSTTSSEDPLAKAKFKDGEAYASASAEARKEANAQLINNLQSEIEVINKAISSWGKDLGVSNDKA